MKIQRQPKHELNPNNWVNAYADYLYNYTIVRVNDKVVAEDIVQNTFLAGLNSMKNFKGEASERTWLVSILKRKIIDHYRKINSKKGKAEVKIDFSNDEDEGNWLEQRVADSFDKTAEDLMENTELGLAIHECLGKLSTKQSTIFKMKTIQGYETEAICNEFNITSSNLWVIVHRARTALANCLKEIWF